MDQFKGHPVLVVNTASACGFSTSLLFAFVPVGPLQNMFLIVLLALLLSPTAPQFQGLEKLNKDLGPKGLQMIGFPWYENLALSFSV